MRSEIRTFGDRTRSSWLISMRHVGPTSGERRCVGHRRRVASLSSETFSVVDRTACRSHARDYVRDTRRVDQMDLGSALGLARAVEAGRIYPRCGGLPYGDL